jgi:quinoprotein glucose dehydrogenase
MGMPLVKPPWGRITAIDLNKGDIVWQIRARRNAGQRPQQPGAQGIEYFRERSAWTDRRADDEDITHRGEGGFFTTPIGQRGAMFVPRQDERTRSGRRLNAGPANRFPR